MDTDYELIDTGDGLRLERLGMYHIVRPEASALWPKYDPSHKGWSQPDAVFSVNKGWMFTDKKLEKTISITHRGINLFAELTPFRHLGFFPEQADQWDVLTREGLLDETYLNLFSYTGAATIALAKSGARVVHVDASKKSVGRAAENLKLNNCEDAKVRWIVDDVRKFLAREVRRGTQYRGVILDPPVFGRGSNGEIWRIEESLWPLLLDIDKVLLPNAYIMINTYATALYPHIVERMVHESGIAAKCSGVISVQPVFLRQSTNNMLLQTGFQVSNFK
jgi:23S rRNA (cytosine1962-C5)-methyltransferase